MPDLKTVNVKSKLFLTMTQSANPTDMEANKLPRTLWEDIKNENQNYNPDKLKNCRINVTATLVPPAP